MATNCDDIFNQIKDLQSRRNAITEATERLDSVNPDDLDATNRDKIFRRSMGMDETVAAGAAEDVAKQRVSNRQRGRFNNAAALVDRIGEDQATSLLTLMKGLDETWKDLDPADYAAQVAAFSRKELEDMLTETAYATGIDLDDALVNGVQANLAPFLPILQNQAKLKVYAEISRGGLLSRIDEVAALLESGNYQPGELAAVKQRLVNDYLRAVTAQRARNIARTRSGQLLRNERDLIAPRQGLVMDVIAPKKPEVAEVQVNPTTGKVEVDARTLDTIKKVQEDIEEMIGEKVGATAAELSEEGSVFKRIVEATNEGAAGAEELRTIAKEIQADTELAKIGGSDDLTQGFDFAYEKIVRAGYKDSILGGLKSILFNNYASQKIVFAAEGFMKIPDNAARIYVGNVRNPVGTATWRNPTLAIRQGASAALRANLSAESVIKQSYWDSIKQIVNQDDLPFAGNTDRFNNYKGQISMDQEYEVANRVLKDPVPLNPIGMSFAIRNKLAWGSKMYANHMVEQLTGTRLPVLSVLKTNQVIDNRMGLRTFMTDRSNELQLEYIKKNPETSGKPALDYANEKVAQELYDARPTPEQIASYRKQFDIEPSITDDQVKAAIVYTRVGQPVLDTPSRQASFQKSRDFRMQGDTAQDVPVLKQTYNFLNQVRQTEFGDSQIPFLKAWAEQTAWDLGTGGLTTLKTAGEIAGVLRRGEEITPELYGKLAGSATMTATLLTLFAAMEMQGDDAPIQLVGSVPLGDKEFAESLRAQGKLPNSIHFKDAPQAFRNMPFGSMPLVKTLMLYKDLKTLYDKGVVSDFDLKEMSGSLVSVFTGLIMRAPGLYSLQWWLRALGGDDFIGGVVNEFLPRFVMSSWNPTTGVSRTVNQGYGAFTGADWESVINTSKVMESENDLIEKLPSDHPLKSNMERVRRFLAQGGTPELFRLMGGRDRKYTYLGRKWGGLPFLPASQVTAWPDGVPALDADDGDGAVESELDRLGKFNEPPVFRSHMLSGIPVTPTAINELEFLSGTQVSGPLDGKAFIGGGTYMDPTGRLKEQKPLNITGRMSGWIKGNTWRQALNALFTSPEYAAWEGDPATTTRGSMSDDERDSKPAAQAVDYINKHFTQQLENRFVEAGAQNPEKYPGAVQYLQDRKILVPSQGEMRRDMEVLRDVTNPANRAQ